MDLSRDARITAYILNQMSLVERISFEAEMSADVMLRQDVEEFRAAARLLENSLGDSARPMLSRGAREAIEAALAPAGAPAPIYHRRLISLSRIGYLVGPLAAIFLCVLTLWAMRASSLEEKVRKRSAAAELIARLDRALRQYQSDFHSLPPDTGFGLQPESAAAGAGATYDAGSLWRYLAHTTIHDGKTYGPYLSCKSEELRPYNDPKHGQSYYVVDSWGTPIGYIGSQKRVIHNRGGFDLFSAGPDGKTGADLVGRLSANLAYDGLDNDDDGTADNSSELGGAKLNGCLTLVSGDLGLTADMLDDVNNWDPAESRGELASLLNR